MSKIIVIGVECNNGVITLTDPEGLKYVCKAPEELWQDLMTIAEDDDLPTVETTTLQRNGPIGEDEVLEVVGDQIRNMATDRYGEIVGRGVGVAAQRLGPSIFSVLRKVSDLRNDRPKR